MCKTWDFILSATVCVTALTAIIYAIGTGFTVPVWAIILFIIAVFVVATLFDKNKSIKIKYFISGLQPIEKINVGDWIDLRAAERVELKKGETHLIRLGVGMILPVGYEAIVLPRSSTHYKFGIMCANSMGVIDNSYSGDNDEWKFPAIAIRDTVIEKGDRIAQFRIVENQPRIRFKIVSNLKSTSRGGFGSTGVK